VRGIGVQRLLDGHARPGTVASELVTERRQGVGIGRRRACVVSGDVTLDLGVGLGGLAAVDLRAIGRVLIRGVSGESEPIALVFSVTLGGQPDRPS